jgi:hypothetical protein
MLAKIFPSKYMQNKVESQIEEAIQDDLPKKRRAASRKKDKKTKSKAGRRRKKQEEDSEEESEEEEDEDEFEDDEELGENEGNFQIVFSLNGDGGIQEDEYDEDDDDLDCNSDDEEAFMKETYQKVELPLDEPVEQKESKPSAMKSKSKRANKEHNKSDSSKESEVVDAEQEYMELVETKKSLNDQLKKKPNSERNDNIKH